MIFFSSPLSGGNWFVFRAVRKLALIRLIIVINTGVELTSVKLPPVAKITDTNVKEFARCAFAFRKLIRIYRMNTARSHDRLIFILLSPATLQTFIAFNANGSLCF